MAKKRNLKMWLVMAVILLGIWPAIAAGEVIYVDADASTGGDGQTWGTAYKYLQDGLGAAVSGNQIWVAEGTYKPDEDEGGNVTLNDRYATFQLKNGVAIKGGCAGFGEPDPNVRDVEVYETVLSGDLLGNDGPDFANNYENSYHVVTGSGTNDTAVLDGFTITAGNANQNYPSTYAYGGGMYNNNGSPTITNCTFNGNSAKWGGGMDSEYSSPTVTNCTFSGNSAKWGGGMENDYDSSPTVTNCTFSGNSASEDGGGMLNLSNSNPTVTNCTFNGNSAKWGGGMTNWTSAPRLVNCTFSGNSATTYGGGMENYDNSSPTLTNSILWGNTAPSGPQIYNEGTSSATVSYSDVQGGWPGETNIDDDPCFADPDNGDCHLRSEAGRWDPVGESWVKDGVTSPCIDVGDSGSDWTAELWPHGGCINMGAYGGTPEASMSLSDADNIADLNIDGSVDYRDMVLFTEKWLYEAVLLAEDLNRDGFVNFTDFATFADNWRRTLGRASNPNPADGATGIGINADLSWTAGAGATSHDVYFGTSSPPPFIDNQTAKTFEPGTMTISTTYYWRIDEVNALGKTTGTLWHFTTESGPPP